MNICLYVGLRRKKLSGGNNEYMAVYGAVWRGGDWILEYARFLTGGRGKTLGLRLCACGSPCHIMSVRYGLFGECVPSNTVVISCLKCVPSPLFLGRGS